MPLTPLPKKKKFPKLPKGQPGGPDALVSTPGKGLSSATGAGVTPTASPMGGGPLTSATTKQESPAKGGDAGAPPAKTQSLINLDMPVTGGTTAGPGANLIDLSALQRNVTGGTQLRSELKPDPMTPDFISWAQGQGINLGMTGPNETADLQAQYKRERGVIRGEEIVSGPGAGGQSVTTQADTTGYGQRGGGPGTGETGATQGATGQQVLSPEEQGMVDSGMGVSGDLSKSAIPQQTWEKATADIAKFRKGGPDRFDMSSIIEIETIDGQSQLSLASQSLMDLYLDAADMKTNNEYRDFQKDMDEASVMGVHSKTGEQTLAAKKQDLDYNLALSEIYGRPITTQAIADMTPEQLAETKTVDMQKLQQSIDQWDEQLEIDKQQLSNQLAQWQASETGFIQDIDPVTGAVTRFIDPETGEPVRTQESQQLQQSIAESQARIKQAERDRSIAQEELQFRRDSTDEDFWQRGQDRNAAAQINQSKLATEVSIALFAKETAANQLKEKKRAALVSEGFTEEQIETANERADKDWERGERILEESDRVALKEEGYTERQLKEAERAALADDNLRGRALSVEESKVTLEEDLAEMRDETIQAMQTEELEAQSELAGQEREARERMATEQTQHELSLAQERNEFELERDAQRQSWEAEQNQSRQDFEREMLEAQNQRAALEATVALMQNMMQNPYGYFAAQQLSGGGAPGAMPGLQGLGFQQPGQAAMGQATGPQEFFGGMMPTIGALQGLTPQTQGFLGSLLGFTGTSPQELQRLSGQVTPGTQQQPTTRFAPTAPAAGRGTGPGYPGIARTGGSYAGTTRG